jgi:hypothetical protein
VRAGFEKVEATRVIRAEHAGLVVAEWPVTVARGFRPEGFGPLAHIKH